MKPPRARRRWRGWTSKALTLAVSSLLALLLGEGLVRWLAPQQLIVLRPDIWIPADDGTGWRMAPGVDTRVNLGERTVHLGTDRRGHRIRSQEARADPAWRVLALGDSFLAALQVEAEDTLTARLEDGLAERLAAPVEVVNTGVGGWDPNHYLIEGRRELEREHYDAVLVFLFLGNDAVAERVDRFNPKIADVRHRLRWPRSLTRNEVIKAWLYPVNDALETRSQLFILARQAAWQSLQRFGLSARRLPTTDLVAERDSPRWRITGDLCAELAAAAAARRVPALFVLLPGAYHVDAELARSYTRNLGLDPSEVDLEQTRRLLTAALAERSLPTFDTTEPLRRLHNSGARTHGEVDTHFTAAAHRAVAEMLLDRVTEMLAEDRSS